jgi:hypothetical protein
VKDKRLQAAEQLLQRGVRFKLPAPFLLRWLNPKLTIKAHKPGAIVMFSKVVLTHDLEQAILLNNNEQLIKSIEAVTECLAISGLNGYFKIKLFKKLLAKYLLWQVSKETLVEMFLLVYELNNTKDFKTITKFYLQQMRALMNPNLGQGINGR